MRNILVQDISHQQTQVNSAFNSFWVKKLSTGFGWGFDGNVAYDGWQVKLSNPI